MTLHLLTCQISTFAILPHMECLLLELEWFLGFDYIHGGLGNDRLHDLIDVNRELYNILQTFLYIKAHKGFIYLEKSDSIPTRFRRELFSLQWIKCILIQTLPTWKFLIKRCSFKQRHESLCKLNFNLREVQILVILAVIVVRRVTLVVTSFKCG